MLLVSTVSLYGYIESSYINLIFTSIGTAVNATPARTDPVAIFTDVLKGILIDDLLQIETTEAKLCISLVQNLIAVIEKPSPADLKFVSWLMSTISETVGSQPNKNIWPKFHQIRCADEFKAQWEQYLKILSLAKEPVAYQHVTLKLLEEHLKEQMKSKSDPVVVTDDAIEMTYEEENAIRYMGGYVIRKLKKKHFDIEFLIVDQTFSTMESSEWINLIDRGGLVHITDDCFQFFLSMECAIRRNLDRFNNKRALTNDSFSVYMEDKISEDDGVLFDWMMITGDEEENRDIFMQIIKLWVNVRGHSFANSVLEQYKNEAKKATKHSKGIRTQLFTDKL